MSTLALLSYVVIALAAPGAISGQILDPAGQPVPNARVYLEAGLSGAVVETRADAAGRFSFDAAPAGMVGVFASADGMACGGETLTLSTSDEPDPITIRLGAPGALSGRVSDFKGKPVAGARITRVALVRPQTVGIPLAKLSLLGRPVPTTDDQGRFTIPDLPADAEVAIKVSHPDFAQEGLAGLRVGDDNARVSLQEGVVLQGRVLARKSRTPVADAAVLIRSDAPPRETTVAATDMHGEFVVRLKPGIYGYQAAGAELRSPGWEPLTVTGRTAIQNVELLVAGTGLLRGDVRDAVTRDPVPGARLLLTSHGNPAAIARTAADGAYAFHAAEGDNTVTLQAAPGYQQPREPVQRITVSEGAAVDLQTFWLLPVAAYAVEVRDPDGAPVPGALVGALRPAQLGRYVADPDGRVRLLFAQPPDDGMALGVAEHPAQPLAAPFHLRTGAETGVVQLAPYGRVHGKVADGRGRPLPGVTVAAAFAEAPGGEPFYLWHAITDDDGVFRWDYCVSGVDLRCVAFDAEGNAGASSAFHVDPNGDRDIGAMVIERGVRGKSAAGERPGWKLNDTPLAGGVAVVMAADDTEASAVAEALAALCAHAALPGLNAAVLIESGAPTTTLAVPAISGKRPSAATAYVLVNGTIALETVGLPPIAALRAAAQTSGSPSQP